MMAATPASARKTLARRIAFIALGIFALGAASMFGFLLGGTASEGARTSAAPAGFFGAVSAPIWVILIFNLAGLAAALATSYATLRIQPETALKVADTQAAVAREAIEVAATSAGAAATSAEAANRTSENQGLHAIARLRQEWINELRGRVAEAHALLSNWRSPADDATAEVKERDADRRIKANEVVARIELLLNVTEAPSQRLLAAIRALEGGGGNTEAQKALGPPVIAAGQEVLKEEWDRVRCELQGKQKPFAGAQTEPSPTAGS